MNARESADEARRRYYEHVNSCRLCKSVKVCEKKHDLQVLLDKANEVLWEAEYWEGKLG